jgi:hypothetical protein
MNDKKPKTDQIIDRVVKDALIADLERRQREITEDIENTLRPYREIERDEARDDFESEVDTFPDADEYADDVQLNWDYEEDE